MSLYGSTTGSKNAHFFNPKFSGSASLIKKFFTKNLNCFNITFESLRSSYEKPIDITSYLSLSHSGLKFGKTWRDTLSGMDSITIPISNLTDIVSDLNYPRHVLIMERNNDFSQEHKIYLFDLLKQSKGKELVRVFNELTGKMTKVEKVSKTMNLIPPSRPVSLMMPPEERQISSRLSNYVLSPQFSTRQHQKETQFFNNSSPLQPFHSNLEQNKIENSSRRYNHSKELRSPLNIDNGHVPFFFENEPSFKGTTIKIDQKENKSSFSTNQYPSTNPDNHFSKVAILRIEDSNSDEDYPITHHFTTNKQNNHKHHRRDLKQKNSNFQPFSPSTTHHLRPSFYNEPRNQSFQSQLTNGHFYNKKFSQPHDYFP